MLISVIIPMYNRKFTIKRAMNSVLSQVPNKKEFQIELIVVDDCSTDNSVEVAREIKDERVKIVKLDKNSGANVARNYGINLANGEIIAFNDSDDEWLPEKLSKQLEVLQEKNIDFLCCNMETNIYSGKMTMLTPRPSGFVPIEELLGKNYIVSTQNLIGKADMFKSNQFSHEISRFQDWELILRLLIKGYRLYFMEEVLVRQYIQPNSLSKNLKNGVLSLRYMLEEFKEEYAQHPLQKAEVILTVGSHLHHMNYRCAQFYFKSLKLRFSMTVLAKALFMFFTDLSRKKESE